MYQELAIIFTIGRSILLENHAPKNILGTLLIKSKNLKKMRRIMQAHMIDKKNSNVSTSVQPPDRCRCMLSLTDHPSAQHDAFLGLKFIQRQLPRRDYVGP